MNSPASGTQRYCHVALRDKCHIRLLELYPATDYDEPLTCKIFKNSLEDSQSYSALSYAWDAQIPTSSILCNGQILGITRNCELALRRLRRAQWPRTLWIDSICIDQNSLEERSSQVSLMNLIYGLADTVLIWLGEADQRSYDAMKLISKWADTACAPEPGSDIRSLCLVLGSLLHRSWFRRMWTIQELILAKNPVLHCGSAQLSWLSFREGITQAVSMMETNHPGFFQKLFPGFTLLDALKTPILALPYRTFGLPLSEVFRLVRVRECSDPKDRVYALYGIFLQQDLRLPNPSYSKSVRQIFTEAAWSAIVRGNSLELLSQLSCRSITDDLPSWVPDLARNPWLPVNEMTRNQNANIWSKKPSFTFSDDLERLTSMGLPVDEVADQKEQMVNSDSPLALLSSVSGAFITKSGYFGFRALLPDEDPTRTPYAGDLVVRIPGVITPMIIRPVSNGCHSFICAAQIPELPNWQVWDEDRDKTREFTFV